MVQQHCLRCRTICIQRIYPRISICADEIFIYDQTKNPEIAYLPVQHSLGEIWRWAKIAYIQINAEKIGALAFSKNKDTVP